MDPSVYKMPLAQAFYTALPHRFGVDLRADFATFEHIARFVVEKSACKSGKNSRPFEDAVDQIFISLHQFFEGSSQVHNTPYSEYEPIRWHKLGHLDSGMQGAFKSSFEPDFLVLKEAFFQEMDESRNSKNQYYAALEWAVVNTDPESRKKAEQKALLEGARLTLKAHLFHAERAEQDHGAETLLARKLLELIDVVAGMQASFLTRKMVREAFEVTANECAQMNAESVTAAVKNEFSLRGVA
jgi:hypothetical protein